MRTSLSLYDSAATRLGTVNDTFTLDLPGIDPIPVDRLADAFNVFAVPGGTTADGEQTDVDEKGVAS
ncbi:MAG: hypothetical protein AB8G26_12440 [Ilumatobacter sp.]